MRKVIITLTVMFAVLMLPSVASAKKPCTAKGLHDKRCHEVKVSKAPYVRLGHALKNTAKAVAVTAPETLFGMFDTAVIDPVGAALQVFADGVDMYVVEPLQAAPPPLRQVGEGLFYVYEGVDKLGVILAK